MNTIFEKIYVISMPIYKDRIEFMKNQLDDLGIQYSFIFGTDFDNIKVDSIDNEIKYPQLFSNKDLKCTGKDFSCTVSHYNAVYQAYEFGYNNVLIIEDDVCFFKDKDLIEKYFINIPKDADFVTYDPRFWKADDFYAFRNDLNNCKDIFVKDNGQYQFMFGGMCYGIMNRQTMKLYLENQRKKFCMSDHVNGLFKEVTVNKYIATKCICTDQYNILNKFNNLYIEYMNNYNSAYGLNPDDFYQPNEYDIFERYIPQINNENANEKH